MVISSTTNEWPQQQIDETALMASSGMIMEKPVPDQALKCPRCDSSNTKFCYYNNYSLSQPRHFCKACKRYWTRGGTLRNVPVGGGCRKNKRIKRSAPSADPSPSLPSPAPTPPPPPKINVSTASNQISPLFYGLPSAPSDINLPFPSFNSRASNVETVPTSCTGYDLQPQFNQEYRTGFNHTSQIQDGFASNSLISNYSILGSSSSTRASLMASSLQQQKLMWGGLKGREFGNNIEALQPFHGLQMEGNSDPGMIMKEMKMEEVGQNPIEQIRSSDPSLYWDSMAVGAWPDLNNFGSSVTSLI